MALGYVRPAREADADEIARIQLSTWRTAYASIVPAKVLAQLDAAWLAEHWREACAQPPSPAHQVFMAVEQDESDRSTIQAVGFAAVGPDIEDDQPGTGLVTELLVEPRFGRRGHGSRLLSAAVSHWRAHAVSLAHAWVFTRDAPTLSLYKSAGWDTDGTRRTLDMDGTEVPQLRLHADVAEGPQ
jgi:GNAT superfamily N-acetyltransferase